MKLTKSQLTRRKRKRWVLRPLRMAWRVYLKKEVIHALA
jgi:hypothetical protein